MTMVNFMLSFTTIKNNKLKAKIISLRLTDVSKRKLPKTAGKKCKSQGRLSYVSLKDHDHVVKKQTANLALFPLYSPFYCWALQEPESCPLERTDYVICGAP